MHPNSRPSVLPSLILWLAGALPWLFASSCSDSQANGEAPSAPEAAVPTASSLADAPLDASRAKLLDQAFDAASAMPLVPHVKNRSRAQEAVVEVCLELDQPRRALEYLQEIENWLRGAAYADLALYCGEHGAEEEVQQYLDLAREISETSEDAKAQVWRHDRIRSKIARVHLALGHSEQAAALSAELLDSERAELERADAQLLDPAELDRKLAALHEAAASGSLDRVRSSLEGCIELFDRFHGDAERRARILAAMRETFPKVPLMLCIELTMELSERAVQHDDRELALALADEARVKIDSARWRAEDHIALTSRLAVLRHRAGDAAGARAMIDAARDVFEVEHQLIVDIYRADALRPLAEAYHAMGDTPTALAIYAAAFEAGVDNPNSWPRAEDLSATCLSMASVGVAPTPELSARIAALRAQLLPPW